MGKKESNFDGMLKTDVFKGLSAEEYTKVLNAGFRKRLQSQDILFHQGDPATHCYLVNQGRLKLTKLNEQGRELIIRYVGDGELVAAVIVMKSGFYPVSAESIEAAEVTG